MFNLSDPFLVLLLVFALTHSTILTAFCLLDGRPRVKTVMTGLGMIGVSLASALATAFVTNNGLIQMIAGCGTLIWYSRLVMNEETP